MRQRRHYKTFEHSTALEWQPRRLARAMVPDAPPLTMSPPVQLGGEPGRWTPEELLLAAVESCTLFTFLAEAQQRGLTPVAWRSSAEGIVARDADGRFRFVHVVVRPVVDVKDEEDARRAREVLEAVEQHCFVGNSVHPEPRVEARVVVVRRAAPPGPPEAGVEGPSS